MVKRSTKTDNIALKSKQKKSIQRKKNVPVSMKKSSNLMINQKANASIKITKSSHYESTIRLINESKKWQGKETKQSQKSNTSNKMPSLNDSVIILSDNETEINKANKCTAENNDNSETISSSLGEIFKSFQCLRKGRKNSFSNKTKENIIKCFSSNGSSPISEAKKLTSNASCTNTIEPSNNMLNETIDDIVVVWSSINKSSSDKSVSNDELIQDDKERPKLFMLDYNGDSHNLKCLHSSCNNENQNHEQVETNDNDLLFNKPGLKLPNCYKPNLPINVELQKNIGRISARSCKKNSSKLLQKQQEISNETRQNTIRKLREIIIDGCNVAMAYTHNKTFSELGLKLVIDYFVSRGHSVKAFVPQHKRSMHHPLLEKLYKKGIVVFTPSRIIGGKIITPYDDRYILEYATMCKGIVVSLDQYRDLYMEKPEWRDTIENRLLAPTFVGDYVMFPDDPLGRNGPTLEEFLKHDS